MDLIAGPSLYSACRPDLDDWARSLAEWRDALERFGLRPRIPTDCLASAAKDECLPTFEKLRDLLGPEGPYPAAVLQLLGSLATFMEDQASDVVLYDWDSTGCLASNRCPTATAETVAVAASLQPHTVGVLGTGLAETETVAIERFDETNDDLEIVEESFSIECFSTPTDLVAQLDSADFADRPEAAIAIECEKLGSRAAIPQRFHVLPSLEESMRGLSPREKRSAIRTMAISLLPLADRPRGSDEHELRTGVGANDPQVTSRWGKAYRLTVSKRGAGLRVHIWRGVQVVTFSNVCVHGSSEIFE